MRRWLLALGVLATFGGVLAIAIPGVVQIGPAEGVVIGAWVVALAAVAHVLKTSAEHDRLERSIPDVELPDAVAVPGDDVDARIARALPPHRYIRDRRILRRRVHDLAFHTLTTFARRPQDTVSQQLEEGTWTEDPDAKAFLGGPFEQRGVLHRVRERFSAEDRLIRQLRASLDAIAVHVPGAYEAVDTTPEPGVLRRLRAPLAGIANRPDDVQATGHWRGVSALAFAGIGVGLATDIPVLLLVGAVGIGYAAYARLGNPPAPDLDIERTLSMTEAEPGDAVDVHLRIANRGERLLPDVRIADGVPPALQVGDGCARESVALRAGEAVTLSYTVTARPGRHAWEPVTIVARSLNGTWEHAEAVSTQTELTCVPLPQPIRGSIPLRPTGQSAVGELPADRAGEGVEFQSVRGYRPGDRRTRIDWRRYARTHELTTVEFRETNATTVIIAIDARNTAYLAPNTETPHAVQRSVAAADRLVVTLLGAGHRVGLASVGPDPLWLAPSAERAMKHTARAMLATHPAVGQTPPTEEFRPFSWVEWFRARLRGEAQVILLSPLCDELIVESIVRIEARGYPVTIVSPDSTTTDTMGRRLVAMERRVRLARLRQRGLTVVDWAPEEPIDATLVRIDKEWST